MQALQDAAGLLIGGGCSLGGAYLAIKVHIRYLIRDNERQDKRLSELEAQHTITARKADVAHVRIDQLTRARHELV